MMEEVNDVDIGNSDISVQSLQCCDSIEVSDDGPPDPRIQIELEKLNSSTDLINKLEVELDEARMMFRQILSESTQRIDNLTKRLGKCVDQSRPYYDSRIHAKQALVEAQKSALRYERAVSQHAAAREMVQLAEEGLMTRGCIFDSTWQEMLNHATNKVNEAEVEKIESSADHREKSEKYHQSETRVKILQKDLKRAIAKSSLNIRRNLLQLTHIVRMQDLQLLPYFELKAAVNRRLEEQKGHVKEIEESIIAAKKAYSEALTNLETISNQIHQSRQSKMDLGVRGSGVGAECPDPGAYSESLSNFNRNISQFGVSHEGIDVKLTNPSTVRGATLDNKISISDSQKSNAVKQPVSGKLEEHGSESISGNAQTQDILDPTSSEPVRDKHTESHPLESTTVAQSKLVQETKSSDVPPKAQILKDYQFNPPIHLNSKRPSFYLTVDDDDSLMSDSESIASVEMLGDEVISNLMLDEDHIAEPGDLLSPSDKYSGLACGRGTASLTFIPSLVQNEKTSLEPAIKSLETKELTKTTCPSGKESEASVNPQTPPDSIENQTIDTLTTKNSYVSGNSTLDEIEKPPHSDISVKIKSLTLTENNSTSDGNLTQPEQNSDHYNSTGVHNNLKRDADLVSISSNIKNNKESFPINIGQRSNAARISQSRNSSSKLECVNTIPCQNLSQSEMQAVPEDSSQSKLEYHETSSSDTSSETDNDASPRYTQLSENENN